MNDNILTISFLDSREVVTESLVQYDYGIYISVTGVELPDPFEVQLANSPRQGGAKTVIGQGGKALIPDELLTTGAPIYAYIVLHSTEDDGRTVYIAYIPVKQRPVPTTQPLTPVEQSTLEQAIALLSATTQDIDGKIDTALSDAMASGEFDGSDGVGVKDISFNGDSMKIELTDGTSYTSPSLQGPEGPRGEQGIQGEPGTPGEDATAYKVTISLTSLTADKSFSDVLDAYNSGRFVFAEADGDIYLIDRVTESQAIFSHFGIDGAYSVVTMTDSTLIVADAVYATTDGVKSLIADALEAIPYAEEDEF